MSNYLSSYDGYFWNWDSKKEVTEVVEGSTIAYTETLSKLLKGFTGKPIPSFGTLLLVIIATNDKLSDDLSIIEKRLRTEIARHPFESPIELTNILEDAIRLLRMVEQLPDTLKSANSRIQTIVALFENAHNLVSQSRISGICRVLDNPNKHYHITKESEFPISVFRKEFRPLAMMVEKFRSVEGLIKHLTAIPSISEELMIEGDGEDSRTGELSLIDKLIQDPGTFQIGSLIKRIWSGLSVPYHLSLPSGQPLGGFSDITNKGDYDKILISEFANDDAILLSRLANNEALFLRREEPPSDEEFERVILVDVSIRNWGTPKIIAYALLIAIANHPKTDITCTGYAVGNDVIEIKFGTVDEVLASLEQIDTSLNPSKGLSKFLDEFKNKKNVEVFYISSIDSIKYPEMQQVLNEHHAFFKYWINVSRDGDILLYKNQFKSKRLIQEIKLPLEELWSSSPRINRSKPEVNSNESSIPLLIPAASNYIAKTIVTEHINLIVSRNKDLSIAIKYPERKGLNFVTNLSYFTKDTLFAAKQNENTEIITLCYVPNQKKIHVNNLTTKEHREFSYLNFSPWSTPEIICFEGEFYFIGKYSCYHITYEPKLNVTHISKVPDTLKEFHNSNRYGFPVYCESVLQNVKSIAINNVGNLIFNGRHELRITHLKQLRLERSNFMFESVRSGQEGRNSQLFKFPEGSTIEASKTGYLKFVSSNKGIDEFYIPTALDFDLAIVNKLEFAGNKYFNSTQTKQEINQLSVMNDTYLQAFIKNITQTWS
ncbi:MAG: hypothetical protein NXI20_06300 [bacterium]|nr:hypothetical protein [bacterium]